MNKKLGTTILIAALVVAGTLLFSAPSSAVEVKVSGQIDRMVMWADNGDNSELFHVDNTNSSTRFLLTGSQDIGNGVKAGFTWETEFASNPSSKVDIDLNSDIADPSLNERKFEAYFDGAFGKVSLGQGDGAANTTAETDLSGTSVVTYSDITVTGGSLTWRDSDGNPIGTGLKISDTRNNFDGLSRLDRLRYDTPSFGGFKLAGSMENGGAKEVSAWFNQQWDGIGKLAVSVGYIDTVDRVSGSTKLDYTQWDGSASFLHASGLNLTVSYGTKKLDDRGSRDNDPINYYVKLGYKMGKHAISAEYGDTEDLKADGDSSTNWGLGYVYNIYDGIELFAGYRIYSLDRDSGPDIDSIQVGMLGTRVKFW
jgi:predicted porin